MSFFLSQRPPLCVGAMGARERRAGTFSLDRCGSEMASRVLGLEDVLSCLPSHGCFRADSISHDSGSALPSHRLPLPRPCFSGGPSTQILPVGFPLHPLGQDLKGFRPVLSFIRAYRGHGKHSHLTNPSPNKQ